MPTLLRWKGYRFFFYSADGWEPPHVHVVKDGREAKIWLRDLNIAVNLGFSARDLNEIIGAVREHRNAFLEAWNDYFGA
ncbi:DUF4160 domain-containing protein [Devosia sp. 63-57]|uniref:DUF4160 domain-containing protein n=1 Tax=Devosia sp. 63-57 TaxID=1895751 RepID=UPI00086A60BD|nr:DUF4160 domain-containing protein [Devosia sp. 63-57]ODT49367.1 MAG: hypothetical protein ABS74_07530 [Pelagibacterium sp. SCN 63-126]ODU82543.1 MAG: hypothetical protein ABT14_16715 [Pelagibacterium sp. SCN 63-17]OJX41969.1 MAG: hypothetical protein BGO80_10460 [Devosia sp. 63-57]